MVTLTVNFRILPLSVVEVRLQARLTIILKGYPQGFAITCNQVNVQ